VLQELAQVPDLEALERRSLMRYFYAPPSFLHYAFEVFKGGATFYSRPVIRPARESG
jgi:hypothetical protein